MPGRAQGRAYGEAQLAGGALMFSGLRRGKRTPWDRGTTVPAYDVYGDVILHIPSAGNSI